jgi:hypothetical protein
VNTYYTPNPALVDRNLTKFLKVTFSTGEMFYDTWDNIDMLGWSELLLAPGHAFYFFGGRESLVRALKGRDRAKITTTDGAGMSIAAETGIRFSGLTKIGSFFKSHFPGRRTGAWPNRPVTIDVNRLMQKTLTVVAVYHSDTGGRHAPETRLGQDLIENELTMNELAVHLSHLWVDQIINKIEDRQQAVNDLFEQLWLNE